MDAIPTIYKGLRFRSRLEATWAAFFDALGWPWSYEPFDLSGWIPDFLIMGACGILVEVKPIWEFDEGVGNKMLRGLHDWRESGSGPAWSEPLLLGIEPFIKGAYDDLGMGWCAESWGGSEPGGSWWELAVPGRWEDKNPKGMFGYCHAYGQYCDRITGGYDGGSHGGGDFSGESLEFWHEIWACVKNGLQWKPPEQRHP